MDRTGLEPVTYRTSLAPITRYPVSTASTAGIEPAQDGTPIALPIELSVRVLKIQHRFSNLPRAVIGGTKVSCVHGQFGRKFIRNCCFSAKLRRAHFFIKKKNNPVRLFGRGYLLDFSRKSVFFEHLGESQCRCFCNI